MTTTLGPRGRGRGVKSRCSEDVKQVGHMFPRGQFKARPAVHFQRKGPELHQVSKVYRGLMRSETAPFGRSLPVRVRWPSYRAPAAIIGWGKVIDFPRDVPLYPVGIEQSSSKKVDLSLEQCGSFLFYIGISPAASWRSCRPRMMDLER